MFGPILLLLLKSHGVPHVVRAKVTLACNELCVQNVACTHWSFGTDNNECYLKNSDSRRNKHDNRISGTKCSHGLPDEGETVDF